MFDYLKDDPLLNLLGYGQRSKSTDLIGFGIGALAAVAGYSCQILAGIDVIPYNFIAGYAGDYGATLGTCSILNRNDDPLKDELLRGVVINLIWASSEVLQKFDIIHGTADVKDLFAYGLGTLSAIALSRVSKSENIKSFFKKNRDSLEFKLK